MNEYHWVFICIIILTCVPIFPIWTELLIGKIKKNI